MQLSVAREMVPWPEERGGRLQEAVEKLLWKAHLTFPRQSLRPSFSVMFLCVLISMDRWVLVSPSWWWWWWKA